MASSVTPVHLYDQSIKSFRSSKDVNLRGATRWHFDYKVKDIRIPVLDIVFYINIYNKRKNGCVSCGAG
jgi:hypothetical protein